MGYIYMVIVNLASWAETFLSENAPELNLES